MDQQENYIILILIMYLTINYENKTHPRQSWTFDEYTNSEIRRAAETNL